MWGFLLTFSVRRSNLKYMDTKKKPNGYWDKDRIAEEALKYGRPSTFQKKSKGAYLAALKSGILDEVCSHMTIKTYWTEESLKKEALKHTTKSSFRKDNPTAYTIAHERGIFEDICSHMIDMLLYWDINSIKTEAAKHKNRTDFRIKIPGAYNAARRLGILEEVCSHMDRIRTYWTDDMLAEEAFKYTTRVAFQNGSCSAYILSLKRNIIDKVCLHMKPSVGSSGPEKEVLSFLTDLGLHVVPNSSDIISPFELDIYVPSLKLAIEYNGLIWHSEKYKKDNNYHSNKMKMCNEKGIRLINIFADEWRDRKDQVKNYLLSVANRNPINIGARKTNLKTIDKKDAEKFIEESHIQGATVMCAAFGLYLKEELVGVITGNRHHRQGHENIFVLNRLAFKSGISIQGGSSKLLKSLISYTKEKGYSELISWSDNRWSEGRVYEKMGFSLEKEMNPDYSYTKQEKRFSKQCNTKKNLLKKGAIGTMDNTEKDLALTLGLSKIYDCGKKRWIVNLK